MVRSRTDTNDAMTPANFRTRVTPVLLAAGTACVALASAMYLTVRPAMDARSMASASPPGPIGVEVAGRVSAHRAEAPRHGTSGRADSST